MGGPLPAELALSLPDALPALGFASLAVFLRTGAAVMTLPGLGELEVPAPIRLAIALALSLLLLPVVAPALPVEPGSVPALAAFALCETAVGVFLGLAARLVFIALPIAGQFVGLMIGLSNVLQFDPTLAGTGTALSRFLGFAAVLLLFSLGLHALPLEALVQSYRVFPPGAPLPAGDLAETIVSAASQGFALSFQLAAPFVFAGVVTQAALGLIARLVPQIQVFFVAMPAQILAGLLLLALLAGPMFSAWEGAFRDALERMPGT